MQTPDLVARQSEVLPVRSRAMVLHVIEGAADVGVAEQHFTLLETDTWCAPGCMPVTLANSCAAAPAFVFIADETTLHTKHGVFEVREQDGCDPLHCAMNRSTCR